ncbi:MAG TPA: hypothetical protein PKD86_07355 [Gemmatales bacterium]|nr:hypothetical protein [Gemmatales bacterium]HMP59152.1 hypothetical protein [Gemmatales bacterium]
MPECWSDRIVIDPSGLTPPRVRNLPVTVDDVLTALATLPHRRDVLAALPGIEADDL